jgi:hypothetical protein
MTFVIYLFNFSSCALWRKEVLLHTTLATRHPFHTLMREKERLGYGIFQVFKQGSEAQKTFQLD